MPGRELHRQALQNRLIGLLVDDDLDVGMILLELRQQGLRRLAFIAVGITGDTDLGRSLRGRECDERRQAGEK